MIKKVYPLAILLTLLLSNGYSQVVTVNMPQSPDGQFFINDLNNITLINTKPNLLTGYLTVTIVDANQVNILTLQTAVTQLQPGFTSLASSKLLLTGTMTYGSNSAGLLLRSTGQLPPGQYVFCGIFYATNNQLLGSGCQEREIEPLFPPRLTYPQNGQAIPALYPILTWTAPGPLSDPNVSYHLRLVQVMSGQSAELAYSINNALVEGNYNNVNDLAYPLNAQPLAYGQTYVWQVSASEQGYNLGITQLWTFTPEQVIPRVKKLTPDSLSYPIVVKQLKGDYYVARGILRFAYSNRTNDKLLAYTIYDSKKRVAVPYKTNVNLQYGLNRIKMPIGTSNLFTNGEFYLLEVEDLNKIHYYLSFVYESQVTN